MNSLEYIEINEIHRELKEEYKLLTQADTDTKIEDRLSKGILFKNVKISVDTLKSYNHLAGRVCALYYFICPVCKKRCRKLYVTENSKIACRTCSKIKNKFEGKTQADRIMKIQMYLHGLFNSKITAKKRRMLIKNIITHYQKLDDTYKMRYNTVAFKELQKWCLEASIAKDNSSEYKKAAKDMLKILRNIRKVLVFSGLSISKNNKLTI